ncbi:hypothetical protein NOK12_16470 [Nocardioides sp. OK12]|uniref:hypothetical protein n=1 Tax=Nocardioides sp. OK12 TaxID=2758661 RepID=UPI0021C29429|nr:hypothetical protein [Nocardioides sp. OK12]GHJ59129.1 hypothetical protein NOK12_16470 [Nocardioides sp. OK12]
MTPDIRRAIGVLCIAIPLLVAGLLMPEGEAVRSVLLIAGGWGCAFGFGGLAYQLIRGPKVADEIDAPQPH